VGDLYLIAVNLTRRCNLRCAHCYLDAATLEHGSDDELSSEEVCSLLDDIAGRSTETMVVLTGGEPLLRRDLETLLEHGSKLGLFMVVGSNGVLLNDKRVQSLKAAGAMGIGISLDSLDPEQHNRFRGSPKAWQKTLAGMEACRQHGLAFQIHFSVTETNAHEVQAMIDFARASGAWVLNFFFLVCTGRGESMTDISPARYEQVLNQILQAQEQSQDLIIRARCAPHFQRIAHQRNPDSLLTRAEGVSPAPTIAASHPKEVSRPAPILKKRPPTSAPSHFQTFGTITRNSNNFVHRSYRANVASVNTRPCAEVVGRAPLPLKVI